MEVGASSGASSASWRLVGYLAGSTLAVLGLFCLVVFVHAYTSSSLLVTPVYALGAGMVVLATASAVVGVYYALRAYPQHRRAVLFVVGITAATLLAHAFVIGTPSASSSGAVSGNPSTGFGDSRVTVNGGVNGSFLNLNIIDGGTDAIASLTVSSGGTPLPESGLASPPSFAAPLDPGHSVSGTWSFPANASDVTVQYQYLSCYATDKQAYGCIMDEVYYVPEGMAILNGQQCTTTGAPSYCHLEHPFVAPALIAAGMAVFGQYNVVGWRLMPALLGSFSLPLLFGIAWKLSGSKRTAAIATVLLALDVMYFSQSGAGLLDVPEAFFALAAFFAYFANLRWWKFDRYVVAGILMAVSGLAKETAVFGAMALLTYILFFEEGDRWVRVYHLLKVAVVVGVVFAVGLQAYDSTLARSVPSFVQQVGYMLSYGSGLIAKQLACSPTTGYWCKFANSPGGPPILPTDWLIYYSPVAYYLVTVTVNPGNQVYVAVGYYGITNLLVTWTTFIWVPIAAWNLYLFRKCRAPPPVDPLGSIPSLEPTTEAQKQVSQAEAVIEPSEARFAGFALIFFAWTYVPYIFLLLFGRVTYPFYIVPAIPAIALGASYWMSKKWFPKWLLGLYLVMVFVFFLVYFPDKSFLPVWLRVALMH